MLVASRRDCAALNAGRRGLPVIPDDYHAGSLTGRSQRANARQQVVDVF